MGGNAISGRSRLLGLIADPIARAQSPSLGNALLSSQGRFGAYVLVPMQVRGGALPAVVEGLRSVENFAGAIVSMPHKSSVVGLLDELTAEARLVGAVNVIRRNSDGTLIGTTLDGEGFVAGLRRSGHEIRGAACLLVGAGGAAAAIAVALARHGCRSLTIENRTVSKAQALAARVQQAFPEARIRSGPADREVYDLLVNGTSLGMRDDDPLPIAPELVARAEVVAECVIAPEITRLLELARQEGRAIQPGLPMLEMQMELMLEFMGVGRGS